MATQTARNMNGNGKAHPPSQPQADTDDQWPPTNRQAERDLLASLMAMPEAIDLPEVVAVQPGDFFDSGYRVIYRHLVGARLDGHSPQSLPARLAAAGETEAAGGDKTIFELLMSAVSGGDAVYFADLVREAAEQRKLWQLQRELLQQVRQRDSPAEVRAFLATALNSLSVRNSGSKRFQKLSAVDLDAISDDVPYIIPNVLPWCQPTLCCGGSKSLKTTVLCDLTLSAAWGGRFLGYFPIERKVRAWFISGESGDRTIRETNRRIAAAAGRDFSSTKDYFYSSSLPQLNNAADVAELGREIQADGITLLVVDPLYLCMDLEGREGSLFAVGKLLNRISEVCAKNNCTLIIVHHASQAKAKRGDFSRPTINDASWAGSEQFARAWILLGRREAYLDGSGQHRLWLATGGSAGHGGLYHLDINEGTRATPGGRFWDVTVTPETEAAATDADRRSAAESDRDRRRREEQRGKILKALRQSPNGETKTALKEAAGVKTAILNDLLDELVSEGQVERCEVRKHTSVHDGFRLTAHQKEL